MSSVIDYSWRSSGNCIGYDVNDFYPERGTPIPKHVKRACEECPVKQQCLNHALLYERYGYWAGTTEERRRSIRREKGIKSVTPEIMFNQSEAQLRKQMRNAPASYFKKRREQE